MGKRFKTKTKKIRSHCYSAATRCVRDSRWLLWTDLGYVITTSLRGFWGYPDGPTHSWPSSGKVKSEWKVCVWTIDTPCSACRVGWSVLRPTSSPPSGKALPMYESMRLYATGIAGSIVCTVCGVMKLNLGVACMPRCRWFLVSSIY